MQKLQIVMKELPLMTVWCRITTLKLHDLCDSKFAGQTVRNNFARVLQTVVRQSAGTLSTAAQHHVLAVRLLFCSLTQASSACITSPVLM
jgi:hypothetical protein